MVNERYKASRSRRYKADFLWPHAEGSIEEAGYEFANARIEEYQQLWWDELINRMKLKENMSHKRNKSAPKRRKGCCHE